MNELKIALLGAGGVGKTCIITRFTKDQFSEHSPMTIGHELLHKTVDYHGEPIKLNIWDTAGQERYQALTRNYYHQTDGFLLVCDLTDRNSLKKVKYWLAEIDRHKRGVYTAMLVGNKVDLERQVSLAEASSFASASHLAYVETSAKDGTKIKEAFSIMIDEIKKNQAQALLSTKPEIKVSDTIHLDPAKHSQIIKKKRSCACAGYKKTRGA